MTITEEQVAQVKEQLLKQLENFPEDKREQIREQIESMDNEQVENFIQQNQLTHMGGKCIFCSIVAGKNPAFKVVENGENIAILEINPLSKGHSLIVPKEHLKELPESAKKLAEDLSKRLQKKFSPQKIETNEIKIMDHPLLEVIPLYGDETERKKAPENILQDIQEEILKPSQEIKIQPKKEDEIEIIRLPPRIP